MERAFVLISCMIGDLIILAFAYNLTKRWSVAFIMSCIYAVSLIVIHFIGLPIGDHDISVVREILPLWFPIILIVAPLIGTIWILGFVLINSKH